MCLALDRQVSAIINRPGTTVRQLVEEGVDISGVLGGTAWTPKTLCSAMKEFKDVRNMEMHLSPREKTRFNNRQKTSLPIFLQMFDCLKEDYTSSQMADVCALADLLFSLADNCGRDRF